MIGFAARLKIGKGLHCSGNLETSPRLRSGGEFLLVESEALPRRSTFWGQFRRSPAPESLECSALLMRSAAPETCSPLPEEPAAWRNFQWMRWVVDPIKNCEVNKKVNGGSWEWNIKNIKTSWNHQAMVMWPSTSDYLGSKPGIPSGWVKLRFLSQEKTPYPVAIFRAISSSQRPWNSWFPYCEQHCFSGEVGYEVQSMQIFW